jgi:hypothetical protein
MTKARILANLISDNAELADGQISVAEVVGAAPLASPTFTGTVSSDGLTVDGATLIDGAILKVNNSVSTSDGEMWLGTNAGGRAELFYDYSLGDLTIDNTWGNAAASMYFKFGGATKLDLRGDGSLIHYGATVHNEGGGDHNFRVESDAYSNMLFVDAGNNRVGIKTSAPDATLDIVENFSTVNKLLDLNSSGGLSGGVTGSVYGLYADIKSNNNANAVYGGYFQASPGTGDPIYAVYGRAFGQGTSGRASIGVLGSAEVSTGPTNQNPLSKSTGVVGVFAEVEATGTDDNSTTSALTAYNLSTYGRSNFGAVIKSEVPTDTSLTRSKPLRVYYGSNTLIDVIGSETDGTSETVFNQSSIDHDFRVESNSKTHMLFVDGGNNRVGINKPNPSGKLHIRGNNDQQGATLFLQEDNNNTSDFLGTIYFGNNADDTLAHITSYTNTNNTTSLLQFNSTDTGSIRRNLDLGPVSTVFNQDSADMDFRIESDGNTHALFVQGSDGSVGIGESTPTHQLEVKRATGKLARFVTQDDNNGATNPLSINYNASLRLDNQYSGAAPSANGTKVAKIQLSTVTSSGYGANGAIIVDADTGTGHNSGEMSFAVGSDSSNLMTERMRINKSGYVTKPYHPCFTARSPNGGSTTNGGTDSARNLLFTVIINNNGNHYNSSNGRFTAPVTGHYYFAFNLLWDDSYNGTGFFSVRKNDLHHRAYAYIQDNGTHAYGYIQFSGSAVVQLNANEWVTCYANIPGIHVGGESNFTGFLLG